MNGTITGGALIGAMILGGRLWHHSAAGKHVVKVNGAMTAYKKFKQSDWEKSKFNGNLSPISRPKFDGEIEFKHSYKFDGSNQPIIENLTFKIPAGQKVALVGKMGSGKSTLSRLIAGILEPTTGAILIDGVDVRQLDPADKRKILELCYKTVGYFLVP